MEKFEASGEFRRVAHAVLSPKLRGWRSHSLIVPKPCHLPGIVS